MSKKGFRERGQPPYRTPEIVNAGDPNCQHTETVKGFIGTCTKCKQVKDYTRCQLTLNEYRKVIKGRGKSALPTIVKKVTSPFTEDQAKYSLNKWLFLNQNSCYCLKNITAWYYLDEPFYSVIVDGRVGNTFGYLGFYIKQNGEVLFVGKVEYDSTIHSD
jgi:hypothetical protein